MVPAQSHKLDKRRIEPDLRNQNIFFLTISFIFVILFLLDADEVFMCVLSMVADQYNRQFPDWHQKFNLDQFYDLSEVVKRLDALDKALNLKDCKDKEKEEFLKKLSDRIAELENKEKEAIINEWPG